MLQVSAIVCEIKQFVKGNCLRDVRKLSFSLQHLKMLVHETESVYLRQTVSDCVYGCN